MLISLDWLNELIDLKTVNLEDLLETLTLGGFEVENSYELNINNNSLEDILNHKWFTDTLPKSWTGNNPHRICVMMCDKDGN